MDSITPPTPNDVESPDLSDPGGTAHPAGAHRFVAVFVVVVLGLLTGYRYAIDSQLNDWYLFQVAKHTSWVLDGVGYRADLEKSSAGGQTPSEVRAVLRGETPPQIPAIHAVSGPEEPPLTAWEKWRYRAHRARLNADDGHIVGPQVLFILSAGHRHRIETLETEIRSRRASDDGGASAEQVEPLRAEVRALQQELQAGLGDPETRRGQQGKFFNFIVIPECGAIEVMAIFLAAVIAFPAGWRTRLAGLVMGLPVLYAVNIFRLSCLAYIGAVDTSGAWFEFCHEYVWQAVYVIFVVVVWMAWVAFFVRRTAR